jgi:glycosyltransferase involved in cell wall biosynthesis
MEDNLPNTVLEALSCGTPCVAFDIGGMSDMIDHQKNGYLAKPFDVDDLAMGIRWVLADENRRRSLGRAARNKVVAEYGFESIARRHVRLYEELTLATNRSKGASLC